MSKNLGVRLFWLAAVNLPLVPFVPMVAKAAEGAQAWASVSQILDKHCARCHEAGKTTGRFKERPAGDFGFVLDEKKLIGRNKLIVGNADASPLFVKVVKGDMPKDISDACYDGTATAETYCGLSKDEQATLHDAINALPPPDLTADASVAPVDPNAPVVPGGVTADPVPGVVVPVVPGPPPSIAKVTPAPYQAAPTYVPSGYTAPKVFISDRDIIRLISEDSAKATDYDRPNWRYFTFTHLYNAGEPEKDLRVYRMALGKLLNSLSTQSDPVQPVAIDPYQTIYRVDISRLGWSKATWDNIVSYDPYVIIYHNSQFKALQNELKTTVPFIRADWFAFSAARPPLYYSILDLPKTKGELQKRLGMDALRDMETYKVERAGFQLSGVSDNNRMVERHAISTGMYWESYDFGANGDRKNIFQVPLGPPGAYTSYAAKYGFVQDGGEMIFNLPNGFHAYYLSDGKGGRLDVGPTKIVRDTSQRDLSVTNGISCMGCHDKGIKYNDRRPGQSLDQVRDLVLKSGSFPSEVKEVVNQIFPTGDAMTKRLDSDAKHYLDSLTLAGININVKADGVEMVNAMSRRFEENLTATMAAAELGMQKDAFLERLNAAGGFAYDLKLRLQQDIVPRDQFVSLYAQLVNAINDEGDRAIDLTKLGHADAVPPYTGGQAAVVPPYVPSQAPVVIPYSTAKPAVYSKSFDLAFYASATSYYVGDTVTFTLKSEQPCYLTLMDTDNKGRSTMLFPNGGHPDSRIAAGVSIQVPGPQITGFKIRAVEPSTERITASCNASFDPNAGHDYSKDQFAGYSSTRSLLDAQTDARTANQIAIESKLLAVEVTGAARPAAPVVVIQAAPVALVASTADPLVPITAQKSVVLQIRAH